MYKLKLKDLSPKSIKILKENFKFMTDVDFHHDNGTLSYSLIYNTNGMHNSFNRTNLIYKVDKFDKFLYKMSSMAFIT